jgi:hypothetical protein
MAFCAIGLRTRVFSDDTVLIFSWVFAAVVLPLFVSMGLVAPERSGKTFGFLLSLPLRGWKSLLAKTVVGEVVVILPFLGSMAVLFFLAGEREASYEKMAGANLAATWAGIQTLIWYLAFSIGQPNEARAGLAAAFVFGFWCFYALMGDVFLWPGESLWIVLIPWGIMACTFLSGPHSVWFILLAQNLVLAGLWAWTVYRYCPTGEVRT